MFESSQSLILDGLPPPHVDLLHLQMHVINSGLYHKSLYISLYPVISNIDAQTHKRAVSRQFHPTLFSIRLHVTGFKVWI